MTIKERIKCLCEKQGITIKELEGRCGLGNGTIGYWNEGYPNLNKLIPVANYFGVTVDYLLGRDPGNVSAQPIHTDTDMMAAFFGGDDPDLTEEEKAGLWQDAKDFIAFRKAQIKKEKRNKK